MSSQSLRFIEDIRDSIIQESDVRIGESRPLLSKHWDDLSSVAQELWEACQQKSLEKVAASTRKMKNKLRKRVFKQRLEAMERQSKKEDPPGNLSPSSGNCKCSQCGKPLDMQAGEKCIDGALCPSCSLAKKQAKQEPDADKKQDKTAKDTVESKLRIRQY
jgi:CRISPR/Cas system-associated protein Cas10 (large subunit of type III CRISPR-Cas system)